MAILTNLGQLTRDIFRAIDALAEILFRLINRSKLVERSLFALIDLLQETKSIFLYFIWRVGDDFHKKFQILEEKIYFILFRLIFLCYYCCSVNLKRRSEHLRLRPDASSLVYYCMQNNDA